MSEPRLLEGESPDERDEPGTPASNGTQESDAKSVISFPSSSVPSANVFAPEPFWTGTFKTTPLAFADKLWVARLHNQYVDFTFLVGNGKVGVPCHRLILHACSSKLEDLFVRCSKENATTEVIEDCEHSGFIAFLKYLYIKDLKVTMQNVMEVRYIGKKYEVDNIVTACGDWISENTNVQNVLILLEKSNSFNEPTFQESALKIVASNAETIVSSRQFTTLSVGVLSMIVQLDTLDVDEYFLFQNAIRWAKAECERQNLEASPANQRKVLNPVFLYIRYPLISTFEQYMELEKSQLFSLKECNVLLKLKAFSGNGNGNTSFGTTKSDYNERTASILEEVPFIIRPRKRKSSFTDILNHIPKSYFKVKRSDDRKKFSSKMSKHEKSFLHGNFPTRSTIP